MTTRSFDALYQFGGNVPIVLDSVRAQGRPLLIPCEWNDTEIPVKGTLIQGGSYPFDGNAVDHYSIEGTIFPSSLIFDEAGIPCLTSGNKVFPILSSGLYYRAGDKSISKNGLMLYVSTGTKEVRGVPYNLTCYVYSDLQYRNLNDPMKINIPSETLTIYYVYVDKSINKYAFGQRNVSISRDEMPKSESVSTFEFFKWSQEYAVGKFISATAITVTLISMNSRYIYSATQIFDVDTLGKILEPIVKGLAYRAISLQTSKLLYSSVEADLIHTSVDGQRAFDGNAINWISKLKSWGGEISAVLELIANPGNPKAWASTWLSFRFGSRLEAKTSLDVLDAVWDRLLTIRTGTKYDGYNVSSARKNHYYADCQVESRMRLVCDNDSLNQLMTTIKKFMEWGAWPSLNNAFDLIPLSFVVDWLGNLSTILDNIDDLVYKRYLKVILCERSVKWKRRLELPQLGSLGSFSGYLKGYSRWNDTNLTDFSVLAGWDPTTPSPIHFLDGTSLLLQFTM